MKSLTSIVVLVLAVALTIVGTFVHGNLTYRWDTNAKVDALVEAMGNVPTKIGAFELASKEALAEHAANQLQCFGDQIRTYRDPATNRKIQVALLMGPTGPISVHTPDICYSSRKFKKLGKRAPLAVTRIAGEDQFWSIQFQSRDLTGEFIRSIYGWSTDGLWQAPETARFEFAGEPYLFKIEFVIFAESLDELERDADALEFVKRYSQALRDQLVDAESHFP